MPVLKHAKKKLRQDKKRTVTNKKVKDLYKDLVKGAKANPTPETISKAFHGIDKAVKNFIIHKNKAARMKSSLSKLIAGDKKQAAKSEAAPVKKAKTVETKEKAPKATKTPTKKASPKKAAK